MKRFEGVDWTSIPVRSMAGFHRGEAPEFRGTTILTVRRAGEVAMAGDGQVTLGQTVMKHRAKKVRKIYHNRVMAGFSGATADALTLFEKFEQKLEQYSGNLMRACVELAKDWRTGRCWTE